MIDPGGPGGGHQIPNGPGEWLKVRAHPGLCEGWGNCHRWAPEVYPLDAEGQIGIHLLVVPPEHAEAAWVGAQVCPAKAITVIGHRPEAADMTGTRSGWK